MNATLKGAIVGAAALLILMIVVALIVVLTGGSGRLETGFGLLAEGHTKKLFVVADMVLGDFHHYSILPDKP